MYRNIEKDSKNSLEHSDLFFKDELKENYSYVILKKQQEEFGSQDILNEFGQVIGKLKLDFLRLNKILEIPNAQDNKIIIIESRKNLFSKNQLLRDKNNIITGKIKKRRFFSSTSKIYLKDKVENKEYLAIGDFINVDYKIIDVSENKLIAKVKSVSKKNLIAQNFDIVLKNHYCIEFVKPKNEKLIIISFAISINNIVSKFHWLSDVSGFVRRIIRLRPFGPGRTLN